MGSAKAWSMFNEERTLTLMDLRLQESTGEKRKAAVLRVIQNYISKRRDAYCRQRKELASMRFLTARFG
jgi:hypothetical protein